MTRHLDQLRAEIATRWDAERARETRRQEIVNAFRLGVRNLRAKSIFERLWESSRSRDESQELFGDRVGLAAADVTKWKRHGTLTLESLAVVMASLKVKYAQFDPGPSAPVCFMAGVLSALTRLANTAAGEESPSEATDRLTLADLWAVIVWQHAVHQAESTGLLVGVDEQIDRWLTGRVEPTDVLAVEIARGSQSRLDLLQRMSDPALKFLGETPASFHSPALKIQEWLNIVRRWGTLYREVCDALPDAWKTWTR